jgi:hypothetical protein
MRMFRWCLAVLVLALMVSSPASAQTVSGYAVHGGYTPAGECFAQFNYPGHSLIGMTTKITYVETGDVVYYWSDNRDNPNMGYAGNTFSQGSTNNSYGHAWDGHQWTIAAFDPYLAAHNNTMYCEADGWDEVGGGWNFIGYWFGSFQIEHTVAATRFDFSTFTSNTDGCDTANYYVVERGVFNWTAGTGWMTNPDLGQTTPPVSVNNQAVQVDPQNLTPAHARTCGSTIPGPFFAQYVWRSKFLGWNFWSNQYIAWNDPTWFNERQ